LEGYINTFDILVLAPHPDDDIIGCGGSIIQHLAAGQQVLIAYLTSGEANGSAAEREKEAVAATDILTQTAGAACVLGRWFCHMKDGAVQAQAVADMLRGLKLSSDQVVYAPHLYDGHGDHKAVAKAAVTARGYARFKVYMYEVWTPLQEVNHFVDITSLALRKVESIRRHQSQLQGRVLPGREFDVAAMALARFRGVAAGCKYAEAFWRLG
jgi:LmbE family N-acetylglucosaminyl deacetylase